MLHVDAIDLHYGAAQALAAAATSPAGQQQQLAIARALAPRPKLLVLDEPTEGIQPSIVQAIEDAIRALRGRMAILLVEQYYDFARAWPARKSP
jgi:ABC-type branched-subunit amino acid transport system ATPase component